MNKYLVTIFLLFSFLYLLSSPSWSETLTMDDLVERNNLYYKKFSNVPFTGEVSFKKYGEIKNGEFINGKKHGEWLTYHQNGQLSELINYKDGKWHGLRELFYPNGQKWIKENFKEGKRNGLSEAYNPTGELSSKVNYHK